MTACVNRLENRVSQFTMLTSRGFSAAKLQRPGARGLRSVVSAFLTNPDAVTIFDFGSAEMGRKFPVIISCEHASNRFATFGVVASIPES